MRQRKLVMGPLFFWLALTLAGGAAFAAQFSDGPAPSDEGPNQGVGETVIIPRKTPNPTPTPTPPPELKKNNPSKINPEETYTLRSEVNLVSVGVVVQDSKGQFIPDLRKDNFKVYEDGTLQTIQKVESAEAPMTIAMVIEFSAVYWQFLYQTMQASYGFVRSLRPEDWVAVIAFDMRPTILQDFTKNKAAAFGALNMMRIPGFRESNLFDAITDAVNRMDNIDGKKAILLVSSGVDTFSKMRYDQTLKKVQASDTPIYAIGTGQAMRLMADAGGRMGMGQNVAFLQADNQLRSFSKLSGGKSYFPRFEGEFGEIYNDISASLRNEYNISYAPTNTAHDGKFRKVKVELLDQDGKPMKLVDAKGKEIKYEVRARDGYYAPHEVD